MDNLDQQQVSALYQRLVQAAPPEVVARAHEAALQQLPPEQQAQIVAQFRRAHDDPNQAFRDAGFDGDDGTATPARIGTLAQGAQQQQPDLLGGIIGSLASDPAMRSAFAGVAAMIVKQMLSGPQGGTGTADTPADDEGTTGGGLADILGQLGGRGRSGDQAGGGLADLLSQLGGGGNRQGGGLTDLLGQLTGGGTGKSGGLGALFNRVMGPGGKPDRAE